MSTFEALGLDDNILKAIQDMGFEQPSAIQEKAIPTLLETDQDLVALAQTGTGKTAAFGFPMIQKIDPFDFNTQGLILSPTRELCLQIANEMASYAKYVKGIRIVAVYGGASIQEQARQLKKGAHIVVATPGRIQDMINRRMVNISQIRYCVLDEADEMLNMGFYEDIKSILSNTPREKYTWLFSATMPKEVARIAKDFMSSPIEITIGSKNIGAKNVSHEYYQVHTRDRYAALKRLVDANPDIFSVIFCRTKRDTQKVAENLISDGYNSAALHGDLSQNQRDLVMQSFRKRQIQMLVATDVAARGIDVDDVTHVINYQLPDEIETYTHRSGRTGRAGKSGISIVIVSKSELRKIKSLERKLQTSFEKKEIPTGEEICQIQLLHSATTIQSAEINHDIDPYLPTIYEALEDFSREELIKKFFSVEFTRFHKYYKKAPDLNAQAEKGSGGSTSYGDETRYFINVGQRDGFDWMSLKDFLKESLGLGRDAVHKVDVKDSFSFFNTASSEEDNVLSVFENFKLEGRKINIELTKNKGNGSRKRKGGRLSNRNRDSFNSDSSGKKNTFNRDDHRSGRRNKKKRKDRKSR